MYLAVKPACCSIALNGHFIYYVRGVMRKFSRVSAGRDVVEDARSVLLKDTNLKRIYFAHAQPDYGTEEEASQLNLIAKTFGAVDIVNPADVREHGIRDMQFYLDIVKACDILVFTRFHGFVLGGVGLEIEFAIEANKEVYEISGKHIMRVIEVPEYLGHDDTVALFVKLGLRK